MTDEAMDLQKEHELDRILSTLYDDGVSAQELERLESLLSGNTSLQDRYWQFVSTHVALSVAGGVARDVDAPRPSNDSSLLDLVSKEPRSRRSIFILNASQMSRIAAVVAFLAVGLAAWSLFVDRGQLTTFPEASITSRPWTVDRMPTITHVSWNGPSFSHEAEQWSPVAAVGAGSVSLQMKQGRSVDGYLFCLPPGASVDLVATFDAAGENCLSVTEIIAEDHRPVGKATFNNSGVGPKPLHANPRVQNRRYGVLGRWSERNTSSSPRFFLLTGSHKLAASSPGGNWQLSEMAVLLEHDDVIHIGWDDSGPAPVKGNAFSQHDDFDDLAATLFISSANATSSTNSGLQVSGADVAVVEELPPQTSNPYRVTLAPGDTMLLKVASDAKSPNAIFVVDASTNVVQWMASNTVTHSINLGAAAVFNRSNSPRELLLIAAHQAIGDDDEPQPWRESAMRPLYEQAGFVILGYEDARHDDDFNDIRLSMLRGTNTQNQGKP